MKGTKTEVSPGVWRLRVFAGRRANGTPIQITKTIHAPDKSPKPGAGSRLADSELAKMVSKVAKGDTATSTKTVGDLLTEWLAHCESLGRSPTTMREYNRLTEQTVRPEIGHLRLSKLTSRDLDLLYAKLTAKGNKETTVRRVHALVSAALHQAERWGYVDRNVAGRASPPPVHAAQMHAPTPAEVQTILVAAEAVEPTLAVLLLLGALTGARRGELCALRWPDIDFDASNLTIARSIFEVAGGGWAEKGTKTHQARTIGLDDLGLEALRRHRSAVDALADSLDLEVLPEGFVFSRSPVGAEPIRPDVVTKFMTRVAKKAGVDTHLHALRHFSATQGIAAGYDPVTVSKRLGHADPSITLRVYSHALEEQDKELAAAVGRTLALPSGESSRTG